MASTNELLVDYHYPLKLINKNSNTNIDLSSKERVWFSQPRLDTNNTWEVLKISLRKPILLNHISFAILNRPCDYELWITSKGVRSALIDSDLNPIAGSIQGNSAALKADWRTLDFDINDIIVSSIEIRMRRNVSVGTGLLVSLGLRDLLMKRTIKTQEDTLYSLGNEVDVLGNPVKRVVQDWRPSLATDNDAFTFWKSGPQPSPDAVVNFYATIGDGVIPKRVDRIWIDPVYSGQNLNIYYSTDPTRGTLYPKPRKADTVKNTVIDVDQGVDLTESGYSYAINTPSLLSENGTILNLIGSTGWIGGEFAVDSGLTGTVNIFRNPIGTNVSLSFNSSTKIMTFTNNPAGKPASLIASSTIPSSAGDRIQFVVIVNKDLITNIVDLRLLVAVSGLKVSDTHFASIDNADLSSIYTAGSSLVFDSKIGYLRNLVIKVDVDSENQYESFMADPESYLKINPIAPLQKDYLRQSNLDNAIFVGAFTTGEDGYGGVGNEFYEEKQWSPVWKDWTVQRGYYYLPTPVAACHLKLEFSKLTEQPYPIYETGTVASYKTFPTYAIHTSDSNGVESVSPAGGEFETQANSLLNAPINEKYAPRSNIVVGSKVVDNIRNRNDYDYRTLVTEQIRTSSLKTANASAPTDITSALVQNYASNNTGSSDEPSVVYTSSVIAATNISSLPSKQLGGRTPGWWYLPGGLKIPAETMEQITQNSTQTEKFSNSSNTSTLRTRFTTTSVHRYDIHYAKRDVGLAYFAGIREFQAFTVDYTIPVDNDEYTVINYLSDVESDFNMVLSDPGTLAGAYPEEPLLNYTQGQVGQVILKTWNSIGTFVKAAIKTVDRGLHSDTRNSQVEPLGLDNTGGFWEDDQVLWSDAVNVWGASSALVGLDFESGLYFSGREAVRIYRPRGVGAAGVRTRIFDSVQGDRMRLCVSVYRPKLTSNNFILQLVDDTPITGSVIYEKNVDIIPGRWVTFKTEFFVMPVQHDLLRIHFLIDGSEEETLYLSDLYDEETSIIYSLSNDGGLTYYDTTELLNEPNKFMVFPKPGNQLKVKVDLYDARDYLYGLTVKPFYLF